MSSVWWPAHWFLSELDTCMLFYFAFCCMQYWGAFVGWIVAIRVGWFRLSYMTWRATRWRSWVWRCVTCRKVGGSIPDSVIGVFHWRNPSGRRMALELTQTLTDECQEYFLGGEDGRCIGLTTLPPSRADCLEIWEPEPPGNLRACPDLYWDCYTFLYCVKLE
jgi:hypothetical protein